MVAIGTIVEGIVARLRASQKEPAAASRRSKVREETHTATPRAAPGSPDEPAMGERGNISPGPRSAGGDVGDVPGAAG